MPSTTDRAHDVPTPFEVTPTATTVTYTIDPPYVAKRSFGIDAFYDITVVSRFESTDPDRRVGWSFKGFPLTRKTLERHRLGQLDTRLITTDDEQRLIELVEASR